jgi:hypothetical protein
VRLCAKDGKIITATATVKCTVMEKSKVVLEYSDRIEDGKPVSDLKVTWERQ